MSKMALQKPPIWLNDHFCQRSRPADCIRAGLQHRKFTVHVVVHQGVTLVGFLQHGINDDAPGDVLQFNDGRADHERDIPRAPFQNGSGWRSALCSSSLPSGQEKSMS